MINIVIPMAGLGSRFSSAGYTDPKPFIKINKFTLIEIVLKNLSFNKNINFIIIPRKEHLEEYPELFKMLIKNHNVNIIPVDKLTNGPARTVLYANKFINNEDPLLIANSDQYVDFDLSDFIDDCFERNLDGSILTFQDNSLDPKWSYAKTNEKGLVTMVREKEPISEYATVGIYFFSKGNDFINSTIDMILSDDRVNNEFYTCPVYNYLIKKNKNIGIFSIDKDQMHALGTPEDLDNYISLKT